MERQYTRVYADTEGASHVEESDVLCTSRAYTPSALPMQVSSSPPTTPCACIRLPVGWSGAPHPSPTRPMGGILAGAWAMTTSDGEVRRCAPGRMVLVEETVGKGHPSRVVGKRDVLIAAVPLPDCSGLFRRVD